MGSIRVRGETGKLYFDFRYRNKRCREQTSLSDTPANRRKLEKMLTRIEAEITLGAFDYGRYFPNSPLAEQMARRPAKGATPRFRDFAEQWFDENKVRWRSSHRSTIRSTLEHHLYPAFGDQAVGVLTRAEILKFRAGLGELRGAKGKKGLSAERINHIITPLRMILGEAGERFGFASPAAGIKSLKVPRTDVEPFTLEEVQLILTRVRADFRNYYTARFFTGMRTAEIDGLKWRYVDFKRREILIREARVQGETVSTKNDGSFRTIQTSTLVYNALKDQFRATGKLGEYVFCNRRGHPLDHNNVTKRVWYPLLRHLGLSLRRPYQTRHTAATLWLAAGENPEWIARQMGHTTTEMLFRVYSRFVPNLTRNDGSAVERLIAQNFGLRLIKGDKS